jgi:hypothetical protein
VEGRGEESLVRMDNKRSVDVLGVRMRVSDAERAPRTAVVVAKEKRVASQIQSCS